ncbi:MAG: hydroxymethylbilane synthase [bacterium]|nr:hydroxymethylbilane synthase [bacterium]MDE0239955.1 hydroxymethylbilane synthase [bacterium]
MDPLRIATRGSQLARFQANLVRDALMARHPDLAPPDLVVVRTTGDRVRDRPLAEVGGKGVFTAEIDRVVARGEADLAVHSMKDMETTITADVVLGAILPRADPRDALVSTVAASIGDLPEGARVGTSSIRRRAQLLSRRPDLEIVTWRGNVDTRLARLKEGGAAATLLAAAGLERLGLLHEATALLDPEDMLPAAGQGAIGVTCCAGESEILALLETVDDAPTRQCIEAERAVIAVLDGSCRTPVAALATRCGGDVRVRAQVLSDDGSQWTMSEDRGAVAETVGRAIGERLLSRAGRDLYGSRMP